jgi:hypothetical protein
VKYQLALLPIYLPLKSRGRKRSEGEKERELILHLSTAPFLQKCG